MTKTTGMFKSASFTEFATQFYEEVPVGQLLHLAGRHMDDILMETTGHAGLASGQISVLGAVQRRPGMAQNFYARLLAINEATLGRYVSNMVEKGLITRERSTSDRRQIVLYPTEAGDNVIVDLRRRLGTVNEIIAELLPGRDAETLEIILRRFMTIYAEKAEDIIQRARL